MKCPKCNYESKKNTKFCVRCGTPLNDTKKKISLKNILILIIVILLLIIISLLLFNTNSIMQPDNTSNNQITIENVTFNIPQKEGYFKNDKQFRFNYLGQECAIKKVEPFETSDGKYTIDSMELSKNYPGGETYILQNYRGEIWFGLKIKKDNEWFHISMLTDNPNQAISFFDWMYKNNDWEGHE